MRGINKSHAGVLGILALGLLSATTTVLADHPQAETNSYSDYARVVDVDPIIRRSYTSIPEQKCSYTRNYSERAGGRHRRGFAPTLVGGLIGGLIGNQFGGGRGNTALTFAGAVTGAAIANSHRNAAGNQRYYRDRHKLCRTVRHRREVKQVDGYRVTYRYKGRTFVRIMDEDPGNRVRIRVSVMPLEHLPEENLSHS